MRIDAHNHPDWRGYNLRRFLANMDAAGIDRTWILTWECPHDEYHPDYERSSVIRWPGSPFPFERCLEYVRREPERFVLGYAPDPRRPRATDHLIAAVEVYNVRVFGELKLRMAYDNPDALRVFRLCGKMSLPVVLHIDYELELQQEGLPRRSYWYGGGLEALERAVGTCPDTIFLGHAPGFWACISGDGRHLTDYYPGGKVQPGGSLVRLLRQYKNLYCDLSGHSGFNALNRDHGFAEEFLTEFQDRILYARDDFDNELQKLLDSLTLPAGVLEKIYYKNALRLVPPG